MATELSALVGLALEFTLGLLNLAGFDLAAARALSAEPGLAHLP